MSDLSSILEEKLLPEQLRWLRAVSSVSEGHGVQAFLVGGTVRDMLLGHSAVDLDISAADATSEFASALAQELGGEVVAHSQFRTFKLRVGDTTIDIAMARRESYAHPGALPTVEPGTIEEDLARRDFSINSMAVSLQGSSWGQLLDPFGGHGDLERGQVRVLHPMSFQDDATRILRALRYAQRLDFRIEPETEVLLRRDLSYLDTISGDRVRHELERIFQEERAAAMLDVAQRLGVLRAVYTTLELDTLILGRLREVQSLRDSYKPLIYLALLAYSVPSSQYPGFIARLNMGTEWARVVRDVGAIKDEFEALRLNDLKPSQLYGLLKPFDEAAIRGCALATDSPVITQRLELFLGELRHVRTALNGDDLLAMGVPQGPQVGMLLRSLLAGRLDGLLRTRADEERHVRERLGQDL